jgi:hypothetical protein
MKKLIAIVMTVGFAALLACDPGDGSGGSTECVQKGGYCSTFNEGCTDDSFAWTELGCSGSSATCCLPQDSCADVQGYCSNVNDLCAPSYAPWEGMADCSGPGKLCCVPLATGLGNPPVNTSLSPLDAPLPLDYEMEADPSLTWEADPSLEAGDPPVPQERKL